MKNHLQAVASMRFAQIAYNNAVAEYNNAVTRWRDSVDTDNYAEGERNSWDAMCACRILMNTTVDNLHYAMIDYRAEKNTI